MFKRAPGIGCFSRGCVAQSPNPKSRPSHQAASGGKQHPLGRPKVRHSQTHVRCRICNRWYHAITYTHLRYRHGIEDPDFYKQEYSLRKITSVDVRRRIAERKFLVDHHSIDYIRNNWGKLPLKDMTKYLGINSSTVRAHAKRLGLALLVEKWSDAKVVRLLKEARKHGRPLSSGKARHQMRGLYKAAVKRFKSWKLAHARAGIPYEQVARRGPFQTWSHDRIIAEIRALAQEGKERDYVHLRTLHPKLYAAARNYFGNWANALRAAEAPEAR